MDQIVEEETSSRKNLAKAIKLQQTTIRKGWQSGNDKLIYPNFGQIIKISF